MAACMWCCTLIALCFLYTASSALKQGEPCETGGDKSKGVCTYLTECESALKSLHSDKEMSQQICELENTVAIICCEDESDHPPVVNSDSAKESDHSFLAMESNSSSDKEESPFAFHNIEVKEIVPLSGREAGVISKEKCDEYANFAWVIKYSETLSLINDEVRTLECSFETDPLVKGGTKAKLSEFPHMALLGYQPNKDGEILWKCGGSLISKNFILTAAHCLRNREFGSVKYVKLGVTYLTDLTYAKDVKVIETFEHPLYTYEKYHDIALLKMDSTDLEMHPALRPACLYPSLTISSDRGIATGFGATDKNSDSSLDLMKVSLDFFNVSECNQTYIPLINVPGSPLKMGITDESMICAGSRTAFNDTCEGDSGGPLQIQHQETETNKCMYDIVGITSFGSGCGLSRGHPGVYTRVSYYIKWIEDIVWPVG